MQKQNIRTETVEVDGETIEVHVGTDNVFEDLGFENAAEMTLKADLAIEIRRIIRARGLTQTRAAEMAGLKAPDISNIVNARLDGISVERLFAVLNRLGYNITVEIGEHEVENVGRTTMKRSQLALV